MKEEYDFVITWVDSEDSSWQKEFQKYKYGIDNQYETNVDSGVARYRDWSLLKYWFRGVEKFAPWVRYIHFVTYGHIPSWLDIHHPKVRIVRHEDFIPSQYLPLFSSRPIELMMHNIPDLSERFVYFNDDFYLVKPVSTDYFFRNGKPCDMAVAKNHHTMTGVMLGGIENDMAIINNEFNLFRSIICHPNVWFNLKYKGFLKLTLYAIISRNIKSILDTHAPTPYLRSTFEQVWHRYGDKLELTMNHRFRSIYDITHWVFRYWQIAQGNIYPQNIFSTTKVFYNVEDRLAEVKQAILDEKFKIVIINDSANIKEIDSVVQQVENSFKTLLPNKSSFEL